MSRFGSRLLQAMFKPLLRLSLEENEMESKKKRISVPYIEFLYAAYEFCKSTFKIVI